MEAVYLILSVLAIPLECIAAYKAVKEKSKGWSLAALVILLPIIKEASNLIDRYYIEHPKSVTENYLDDKMAEQEARQNAHIDSIIGDRFAKGNEPDSVRFFIDRLSAISNAAIDSAMVEINRDNFPQAITHLEYAILAERDSVSVLAAKFNKAVALSKWAIELGAIGDSKEASEKNGVALDIYNSIVNEVDIKGKVYGNRGTLYKAMGQVNLALASYDSALAIDPKEAWIWYNRGNLQANLGLHSDAATSYYQAIKYEKDYPQAALNLSNSLIELGKPSEALEVLTETLAYGSDRPRSWLNMGIAYKDLGLLEKAIASYDSALFYKPDFADAWCNKSSIYYMKQEWDSAMAYIDSALKYNNRDPDYWINKAGIFMNLLEYEMAVTHFDTAFALIEQMVLRGTIEVFAWMHLIRTMKLYRILIRR